MFLNVENKYVSINNIIVARSIPISNLNQFQIGLQTSVREILAKEGSRGLVLGWAPTLIGYSAQGLFKYGFYEVN
jgi:hypothetical protein